MATFHVLALASLACRSHGTASTSEPPQPHLFGNVEQMQMERSIAAPNAGKAFEMLLLALHPAGAWQLDGAVSGARHQSVPLFSARAPARHRDVTVNAVNDASKDEYKAAALCGHGVVSHIVDRQLTPFYENGRRSFFVAGLAATAASFLSQGAFATSQSTYKGVVDYVPTEVPLPLIPYKSLRLLQPFGVLKTEDIAEGSKGEGDRQGAFTWQSGVELARDVSTGRVPNRVMFPTGRIMEPNSKTVKIKGSRVLELGTGTGLVGIAAMVGGASSVVLTDGNPELLPHIQKNVELNFPGAMASRATVERLRWGNSQEEASVLAKGPFDVILATECGYEGDNLPKLFGTMRRAMEAAKRAGVASPVTVIQQTDELSNSGWSDRDRNERIEARGMDSLLDIARESGLRVSGMAPGDTSRIMFNLA